MFNFLNFFKKPIIEDHSAKAGAVPSPLDLRDIPATAVIPETQITPKVWINPVQVPHKNQGQKPKCVASAGSVIDEFLKGIFGESVELDDDWLYAECKKIDGYDGPGTYLRTMLSVLKNKGCLPVGGDPNNVALIAKYKIPGYVNVATDFQSLKDAIYKFGYILGGFHGSNEGWQTAYIRPPKAGETIWGHGTAPKDFPVEIFIRDQNSWGEGWGDKGDFYFDKNYPLFEAWAVVGELPANWETLLPDPTKKPKHNFTVQLSIQAEGDEVKALQNCLVWFGCMTQAQVNTGYGFFGLKTLAAVKLFQLRNGIQQTGNVGPLTLAALNKIFNT